MKVGDVIENAVWVTGDESKEMREKYKDEVRETIDHLCSETGYSHGPVTFLEKRPGDDRVPEVPDHIQGQRVRLLVAESVVTRKLPETTEGSFVDNLDKKDLEKLRKITRKAYWAKHGTIIGNTHVDEIIEEIGIDAALDTLKSIH